MGDLRDYQVDHLLLLVGSNPLPNAVAGKLLVAPGGRITLVHSQGSRSLAEKLREWLARSGALATSIEYLKVKEADAASVDEEVSHALDVYENEQRNGSGVGVARVGLNYTGGTKVMSVHAYRAVERWIGKKSPQREREAIFSYLDASSLCMSIDPAPGRNALSRYVGREVEINIKDLLTLHDWEISKGSRDKPLLPESAAALLAVHCDANKINIWKQWLRDELFPHAKQSTEWKKATDLQIAWPNLPELRKIMSNELGQASAAQLQLTAWPYPGKGKVAHFGKWLSGMWLESAVLSVLESCTKALHLTECCMNIQPQIPGYKDSEHGFEFDVAAMRGYQLFAFSCTSEDSNQGMLKQKLFEAFVRARQMGGDEACAALVCCMKDQEQANVLAQNVYRDMNLEGNSALAPDDRRIRVFGREELADLPRHMSAWIHKQSKE